MEEQVKEYILKEGRARRRRFAYSTVREIRSDSKINLRTCSSRDAAPACSTAFLVSDYEFENISVHELHSTIDSVLST